MYVAFYDGGKFDKFYEAMVQWLKLPASVLGLKPTGSDFELCVQKAVSTVSLVGSPGSIVPTCAQKRHKPHLFILQSFYQLFQKIHLYV